MILPGVFEKFPALRVICGHLGEMARFDLQRLDDNVAQGVTGLSSSITDTTDRRSTSRPVAC